MGSDGQLELYEVVAEQLREAHAKVRELQVPESTRIALTRKLLVITAATRHDLPGAARRLDGLLADLDQGRFPENP